MHKSVYLLAALAAGVALAAVWPRPAEAELAEGGASAPFAASLAGTQPDGAPASPAAQLPVDDSLRRLFDYYLATEGEQSLAAIVAAVEAELERRFAPAAAQAAKQLFQRYLAYKRDLQALDGVASLQGNALGVARQRLDAARALRSRHFSAAEAAGLFGWEDRYDDDALARMQIQQDGSLSAADKRARLAELDRQLDPAMLAARQQPVQHLAVAEQVAKAREQGADAAEVFRIRAANVGEAAAERLAKLDTEEADWQRRIQAYQQTLAALRADSTLSQAEREARIAQLREAGFDAQERLRLSAYE